MIFSGGRGSQGDISRRLLCRRPTLERPAPHGELLSLPRHRNPASAPPPSCRAGEDEKLTSLGSQRKQTVNKQLRTESGSRTASWLITSSKIKAAKTYGHSRRRSVGDTQDQVGQRGEGPQLSGSPAQVLTTLSLIAQGYQCPSGIQGKTQRIPWITYLSIKSKLRSYCARRTQVDRHVPAYSEEVCCDRHIPTSALSMPCSLLLAMYSWHPIFVQGSCLSSSPQREVGSPASFWPSGCS